ncbi:MAG: TRAP transporter substrate-binding protein [Geminicoccaceae bacterium]|nr:TRAP transporter substrate-binding protein [Geminicoccaceae bacterium]
MHRRRLLTTGAATAGAATLAAPAVLRAQETFAWTMVMPWPKNTPGVGVGAERFARRLEALSGGRITITLYGAGELVPPFEVLDAVQGGTADIAHGTPYYWVGKAPVLNYFTGVPLGLNALELPAWLQFGGGMDLWREVYQDFGVVPFYAGSSGVQAGGWFREEIKGVDGLKGLKFRIAGLGAEVMRRLGATPVVLPPGEISPSLLSGAIDAAEWIGPWNDRAFGLFKVAKVYYVPAFHEPGPGLEVIVNKDRYAALPDDLKAAVESAALAASTETLADFTYHNVESLQPLLAEEGVRMLPWPDDVAAALAETSVKVLDDLQATDAQTKKVGESYMAFLKKAVPYAQSFDAGIQSLRQRAFG